MTVTLMLSGPDSKTEMVNGEAGSLISTGLKRLSKLPHRIGRKVLNSRDYRIIQTSSYDIYTWDDDFDWGVGTPPELSSNGYYGYKTFERLLEEEYDRALEIGCGWAFLTPWVSEFSEQTYGLDPNRDALNKAAMNHSQIQFIHGVGESLPFNTGSFDLVLTNAVLMHIPNGVIENVVSEINRVTADRGTILLNEEFDGTIDSDQTVGRSRTEYERLFEDFEITERVVDSSEMKEFIKLKRSD